MKITELKKELETLRGAKFVSCTYTTKDRGETSRFNLLLNSNYARSCENDITELEIRLGNAKGIERAVINQMIRSLEASIIAANGGPAHPDNTKAGLYLSICPGLKIHLNDGTCEIQGFVQSKVVLVPGQERKIVKSSPEVLIKNQIRKELKIGRFRTLAVDAGHIHSVRLNGETLEFD